MRRIFCQEFFCYRRRRGYGVYLPRCPGYWGRRGRRPSHVAVVGSFISDQHVGFRFGRIAEHFVPVGEIRVQNAKTHASRRPGEESDILRR